ncbi:MAG: c-type cytochrome [Sulfuricella sp.]|nr:c-type cytochrome [Sulfuricella sp.]
MGIVRFQSTGVSLAACFVVMAGMANMVLAANAPSRSGKEIVSTICIACHGEGKDGAPRIGNTADWAPRAKYGLNQLTRSAMDGVRKMPAHGGEATLSDLEVERAIAYMVSGGRTLDKEKTSGKVTHGTGEQIVAAACGNCHREGSNGAPRIGDANAWLPRMAKGVNELVSSAIHGHNKMPSRGGFSNLSDADIRAAVSFMASKASAPAK